MLAKITAWGRLIRVFNIPIPTAALLAGAYAKGADLSLWELATMLACAVAGCVSTQAYNDYEDGDTDRQNAPFRPIPSGQLSAREVLWGGHLASMVFVGLCGALDWRASIVAAAVVACTRYYSRLKSYSLTHHLLLPAALGMLPLIGGLMVHHEVLPLAAIAGASIFLIDINMNIVGTFKDLFDGSAEERVLPVVVGARRAILVALVAGTVGIALQISAVPLGLAAPFMLVPLVAALGLTVHSRLRLLRVPTAEQGVAALKSGRLSECLSFPAVVAGTMPWRFAVGLIAVLTAAAFLLQALIPEAKLPESAAPAERGTR